MFEIERLNNLELDGEWWRLNGRRARLWGVRIASAAVNDSYCTRLIAELPRYSFFGINAIAVYLMGSSGGAIDPFSSDGKELDPAVIVRISAILRAAEANGMVVVLGIFYQKVPITARHLYSWASVQEAVGTTVDLISNLNLHNCVLNIANEQNSPFYANSVLAGLRNPDQMLELAMAAKVRNPEILIGCGGYDHANNEVLGKSELLDALLFDTNGPEDSSALYDRFRASGVIGKPIMNVELFGGWTTQAMPPGFVTEEQRGEYLREIMAAISRPGLSVFLHSNPWFQGPSVGKEIHFELGGMGTIEDPGFLWYFQKVKLARESENM